MKTRKSTAPNQIQSHQQAFPICKSKALENRAISIFPLCISKLIVASCSLFRRCVMSALKGILIKKTTRQSHLILKTKFPSCSIIAKPSNVDKRIKPFALGGHYEWIRKAKRCNLDQIIGRLADDSRANFSRLAYLHINSQDIPKQPGCENTAPVVQ